GTYSHEPYLAYTKKPNSYPIPDNYVVETTYGKDEKTVKCSISYINEKPRYKIEFGVFGEECVYSDSSPLAVVNAYLKAYNEAIINEKKQIKGLDNIKSFNRALAAICQDLPREKTIYKRLYQINNLMNKSILISLIDLNLDLLPKDQLDSELDVHIMDSEIIEEVENSLGKGNWVIDELHLMLRIYDRLWTLVLSELRSTKCFTDQI
ncbi:5161_t:CDS:2, partial [Cetraspora pellucida]